jgi:hypothetical protein
MFPVYLDDYDKNVKHYRVEEGQGLEFVSIHSPRKVSEVGAFYTLPINLGPLEVSHIPSYFVNIRGQFR